MKTIIALAITLLATSTFAETNVLHLEGDAAATLYANLNGPNVNVQGNVKSVLLETRIVGANDQEVRKFIECRISATRDSGEVETTCDISEQVNDI